MADIHDKIEALKKRAAVLKGETEERLEGLLTELHKKPKNKE
ncbi:hypothetical protein BH10PAT3_BH10PAT3_6130 [soil metagenome]